MRAKKSNRAAPFRQAPLYLSRPCEGNAPSRPSDRNFYTDAIRWLDSGSGRNCPSSAKRYGGRLLGISAATGFDWLHYLSAGTVSFARGLNDTPKIAALLLVVPLVGSFGSVGLVGLVIACGGLVSARHVAETMSRKITPMNSGQGFTANLVTGLIVIGASRLGLPVSTTHVSCGALFGIGTITGQARWGMIGKIVAA